MSVVGKVNPIKIILMPQLLYMLHNSPVVIPLKTFRIVNSIFCTLIWKNWAPRLNWNICSILRTMESSLCQICG